MNELAWRRLLRQIREGYVVPVVGPRLLVSPDGTSLQARLAERLLADHDVPPADKPPTPFRELNDAVSRLKALSPGSRQDLYGDVDDILQSLINDGSFVFPEPLRQLAQISDFRLYVTATPDGLLAKALQAARPGVNEVIYSPRLPTSEQRDLPAHWQQQGTDAQLLYLFGKSCSMPTFAIHDEDVLEHAHNVIARGSNVPAAFLDELQERGLLLLGCNFPDWLSRFFLRATSKSRLSEKDKRAWLIEPLEEAEPLVRFLEAYSPNTEVLSSTAPADFVAELFQRWQADSNAARAAPALPDAASAPVPDSAMFFISYSRQTDLARAQALVNSLCQLGVSSSEIWFDRNAIEPGNDYQQRILDGIRGCRYFVPLLSAAADQRDEAFVFREWRAADDRLAQMNREFLIPVIVDADYSPQSFTGEPARDWSRRWHFGHAPNGLPDAAMASRLRELVRDARRRAA